MKLLLALLPCLVLWACQTPGIAPDFIIEDAHSSGGKVATGPNQQAASAGLDGTIRIWDLNTGRSQAFWQAHRGSINGLAFIDSKHIISAGWDGYLRLWRVDGKALAEHNTKAPISAMALDAEQAIIWTGHQNGWLQRWRPSDFTLLAQYAVSQREITALAQTRDKLAWADKNGRVGLIHATGQQALAHLPTYIRSLVFSTDGRWLFGGSWFHLYRWHLPDGNMQRLPTAHNGIIADLAWSKREHRLFSISRQTDSAVLSLDPSTGATLENYGKHDLCGAAIAISADGRYLLTTSDDASVRIWKRLPAIQ